MFDSEFGAVWLENRLNLYNILHGFRTPLTHFKFLLVAIQSKRIHLGKKNIISLHRGDLSKEKKMIFPLKNY